MKTPILNVKNAVSTFGGYGKSELHLKLSTGTLPNAGNIMTMGKWQQNFRLMILKPLSIQVHGCSTSTKLKNYVRHAVPHDM